MEEPGLVGVHPNDNTATVFIKIKDMFKFIDNLGFTYEVIDMWDLFNIL